MAPSPDSLQTFVQFCQSLKGDEKGESQIFLDRFFRAFGHEGAIEAGAVYEERVKKGSKKGKTGFADLVWKPRVLIEMKKRGEDLNKHYSQAFEYWTRLVPDRPRYVILCNFDEFWIFDFDLQLDTPVDTVPLNQLPERISAFGFMELANRAPVFRNNQVEVTERAARRMGQLLVELKQRGVDGLVAQRFILQCVLAMFAEDRGLLPNSLFVACVQDCLNGQSSYDVLGGLFREMNTTGITPAGRYQGVDYFNGGLFSVIHPLELHHGELKFLEICALEDWSKVRPAIFGNLFESAIAPQERHAHGIHFTSEADIMKIVRPTISRYWEDRISAASTIAELTSLQLELQAYKVLDPACGSGNFLYIAYQELKRIEQLLLDKIAERRKSPRDQIQMGFVTPQQFYGMDTNPFAVELARVTMMIARKIAIDRLGLFEPALPLDTLDQNIECKDALFSDWVKANAIIGNPPFLGGKHMRIAIGDEYIDRVFARFPDVKDSVDFCAYWFRLAHDAIAETEGRAGLVGTNSISQGKSRTAALDYITQNHGYIHEAISTQVWSGEANVHVSIVNWVRSLAIEPSPLAPLSAGEGNSGLPSPRGRRVGDEGVSHLAGIKRQIPQELLQRAKELRQKQTPAEKILWECLRDRRFMDAKFRRQHNIGQYIADFYCHAARLVIELDGEIHNTQIENDTNRDQWMQTNGFTVLRFKNNDVFDQIEDVLTAIAEAIEPSPLAPLPPGEGNSGLLSSTGNSGLPSPRGRRVGDEGKCYLDNQPVAFINSSLKAMIDVTQAVRLKANLNWCFQGVIPVGKGFYISEKQAYEWISADSKNRKVIKLSISAGDLTDIPHGSPSRWIIDFQDMSIEEASEYKLLLDHIRKTVKPVRDENRRDVTRLNWWKYGEKRPAMRKAISSLSLYFAMPSHSKWFIAVPSLKDWLPNNSVNIIALEDFYILGILTSNVHRTWVKAQSSTLEDRTRYTHNTCFETFPFPQAIPPAPLIKGGGDSRGDLVEQIRATALDLHQYRSQQMEQKQWGITKLYNEYFHEPASQLAKLHAQLDRLVLQLYGFQPSDDILEKLLALNLELAAQEQRGEPVIGPWDPTPGQNQ